MTEIAPPKLTDWTRPWVRGPVIVREGSFRTTKHLQSFRYLTKIFQVYPDFLLIIQGNMVSNEQAQVFHK